MSSNFSPATAQPCPALDVTLDQERAGFLRDILGGDLGELCSVRLFVGEGRSGHGLYVAHASHLDDGFIFVAGFPAGAAAPAGHSQASRHLNEHPGKHLLRDQEAIVRFALEHIASRPGATSPRKD